MATASPSQNAVLVHKVRVQLLGTNYLQLREVEVFDTSGVNCALNKPASQSSTDNLVLWSASNAVNGKSHSHAVNGRYDLSITESEAGTYQEWAELEYACFQHHIIHPKMTPLSQSCS
jgi:hypothetical protein